MALPTSSKQLHTGLVVGSLTLLRMTKPSTKESPIKRKKWRCKCVCGTLITVPQHYLVRPEPKTHCGCLNKTDKTRFNREYRIWIMMNVRCTDERHVAYKSYGGRGIKVAPEFAKNNPDGFANFLAHVGPAPTPTHTLDRIDNDKGYQPGNLRWATPKMQAANTRKAQARRLEKESSNAT